MHITLPTLVRSAALAAAASVGACVMTSQVMDAGDGVYMISAHAAPVRGGATGANDIAYTRATAYCNQHQVGTHAIVVESTERDVHQGAFGPGGGGVFAAGNASMHFRCST